MIISRGKCIDYILAWLAIASLPGTAAEIRWSDPTDQGQVNALVVSPTEAHVLYAATSNQGILKSEDGGMSWSWVGRIQGFSYDYPPAQNRSSLAIDPLHPLTLFASDRTANSYLNLGLRSSRDGGISWERVIESFLTPSFNAMLIDPRDPSRVFCSSGFLYSFSRRLGPFESMERMSEFSEDERIMALAADGQEPQTLYAGLNNGQIAWSRDGGQTWERADEGLPPGPVRSLAVDPNQPQVLYAAVHAAGVFKSEDSGRTWRDTGTEFPTDKTEALALGPKGQQTVYVMAGALYKSEDGGISWRLVGPNPAAIPIVSLAVDPLHAHTLYAATKETEVRASTLNPVDYVAAVYKSTDASRGWSQIFRRAEYYPTSQMSVHIPLRDPRTIYVGLGAVAIDSPVGLFKALTTDDQWSRVYDFAAYEMAAQSSDVLYILSDGVLLSTADASSWQSLSLPSAKVRGVFVSPHEPPLLYLSSEAGIYLSENGGQNWQAS